MLEKIETATIEPAPYPHVIIPDFMPDDYYRALLSKIPPASDYTPAHYAGTEDEDGLEKPDNYNEHGLVYDRLADHPFLAELDAFFTSRVFASALLDKFSVGLWRLLGDSPIPRIKYPFFKLTNLFSSVYGLHKDLSGYQISPHPDNRKKIVTWLFYLPEDDRCADLGMGTYLCVPKPGVTRRDLEQGRIGSHDWYDWRLFDIAREARMTANTFFCFAPNRDTYHAVRLDIPEDFPVQERDVFRGFVCVGLSKSNFTKAIPASDRSPRSADPDKLS